MPAQSAPSPPTWRERMRVLLQEDLQDLRSRNQDDSMDDSTLAGDDSRLPNVSPGNSDSDKDPEHNDIPRLWAPGQTPRGIKLRQERQILEQQKLLGVDKVVSSNPGALIGASKYASAPHQSPQAGAFSPQAQHKSAMPVQPAQYQHVILAERTLGAPSATSNSAIEAPPQFSANPTNSGQLPSAINAQDGQAYQTEGVEARILNGVAGLSSRFSPPLTAQNLRQHHNLAAVSSHSDRTADNLRTSLSPQKFKVKVPKYVLDQKDRLQQDLKLSTETIQVLKELIVKYESRENEQRRLLLTMTKERDGLRQQLIERINTDASRASKDSQRQRRELEEARKRAELLSGKVRDMQAALAEADAQLTTYEFQAQQTEVERKESAALLADMTRALQQKHDALTAMSQQCQRAGEDAEARVAELRSRLDASASEKQALQQELADERLQLQQCRDRITELSNLVSVLQTPSSGPHTQSPADHTSLAPSANSTASVGRRSSGGRGDAGQPLKPREAARAVEKVKASPPADSSIAGKISKFMSWTSAASKADRNDVKSPAVPSPPPSSQILEGTPKEARDDLFSSTRAPQVQAQLTFVADKNASPRLSKGSLVASLEAIQYQRKSLESAVSPQRDEFARSPHQEQQKEQALAQKQKEKEQTPAPTPQLKLETGEEEDIIAEVVADFAAVDGSGVQFTAGQQCLLIKEGTKGWTLLLTSSGQQGWAPSSIVKMLGPESSVKPFPLSPTVFA